MSELKLHDSLSNTALVADLRKLDNWAINVVIDRFKYLVEEHDTAVDMAEGAETEVEKLYWWSRVEDRYEQVKSHLATLRKLDNDARTLGLTK